MLLFFDEKFNLVVDVSKKQEKKKDKYSEDKIHNMSWSLMLQ